ncbi:polysaccharide biosynthesis/export family protein [Edaphobacter modestus]|uniref:Polysaccharide export outer membrane protein n=1 Tax=Edaphobacter modestus TaxID=388466 RepID=A0A4Q7YPR1_9BACT|nr:polysaccharide biosynthesis/export family protein [Edaphobacter modestus]RZU39667.1 polysaccharide export outer membrane protein [Edaphobacter modestus]
MSLRSVLRCVVQAAVICCLLLGIVPFARCQFNGPALASASTINEPVPLTTDPAILFPAAHELRLAPGDMITVHLYSSADYTPAARVSLDGSIQLPLIGKLEVKGLTLPQAEKRIADRLIAGGMYRNPQVSLQLTESPNQVATVTGELHVVVPIIGQSRLLDVITAAGGLPSQASHTITIHRIGMEQPIVVDLGSDPMTSNRSNIPIFAGDTVIVARTGVVYMLGAFKNVGAIPLQQTTPLTLMEAATLAGGPGFQGKMGELRLVRTVGANRTVVHLDMKRVIDGKDPDPVLQTDDIVILPSSLMKSAIKSGGISTLIGFASILVVALRQ